MQTAQRGSEVSSLMKGCEVSGIIMVELQVFIPPFDIPEGSRVRYSQRARHQIPTCSLRFVRSQIKYEPLNIQADVVSGRIIT